MMRFNYLQNKLFSSLTLIVGVMYFIGFPQRLELHYHELSTLVLVSLAMVIFWFLPRYLDTVFAFFVISFSSFYFGGQQVYFRAFRRFAYFATLISMRNDIGKNVDSINEFFVASDVFMLVVPLTALVVFILIQVRTVKSGRTMVPRFIAMVLFSFIGAFAHTSFTQKIEASLEASTSLSDLEVFVTMPSSTLVVERVGLSGLLLRDFEVFSLSYIVHVEATLEDEIALILKQQRYPSQHEYSGIFEGKSLLLIEAESLNNFAIHPVLTPTLHRLKTQGLFIEGYNSPLLAGSTSDTEFMVNTGLLPSNNGYITFQTYAHHVFPLTLANSFNNLGYYSMASHNNYGEYYNRTVMLPKLGYKFYDAIELGMYDNVLDSKVIDYIKWIMYEYDNYFSFWITFNGHQPYNKSSLNKTLLTYYNQVDKLYPDWPEGEKVFLAKNMDFDRGLRKLIIDFKNARRIDDLVIIIYGDHFPKGIFQDKELFRESCESRSFEFSECFKTPFIIWNNDSVVGTIKKVSSPLDISPTIYDLFNIQYNPKLILGHSVFDPEYDGFLFSEYDVIYTDHFTYDVLRDTLVHNWTKSEDEFRKQALALYQKLQIGYKIVETNYFASHYFLESTLKQHD